MKRKGGKQCGVVDEMSFFRRTTARSLLNAYGLLQLHYGYEDSRLSLYVHF
jgi:hypothetical protein